ncbi:MAG: hydrogenase accessory protein HypB [Candidatus Zixiibacteriota bacterium]|nr:MAG: hydrogenase accessory protein HypB [candidate division Zixibacteria bacterium]
MEINVVRHILHANNQVAAENRRDLATHHITAVNLMSSPGAGKTAILERTLEALRGRVRAGIIEGDITTTLDAERLARFDFPTVQINTEPFGGDCHLSASAIRGALAQLPLPDLELLFIENVGNLVCPAEFDIGETAKVVVLSLPEGEDKPLKYPLMFRESKACLLNKMDLATVLGTDVDRLREHLRRVNPGLKVIPVSARTGEGMTEWLAWLDDLRAGKA